MKLFGLVLIAVFGFSLSVFSQVDTRVTIDDLSWIAGCWENKGKTEGSYTMEHWTKPAGMMLAVSRTVKNGRVGFFEYLRIIEKDADIFYVAKPANAEKETFFKLVLLENKNAVFENPEHDFPQRIVYKLENENTIAVRVEADKDGKPKGFGFSMDKVSCDQ